jgi:EAL domain-containing protein (putative c-di-GMP-specific phosphodiesterase class I)
VVDLSDGHLVSVEALLRWPDPKGGMIPPGEFIPLAEEMGLIEAIGDWVLGELCAQLRSWRTEGLSLKGSYNLSPRQVWQTDLLGKVVSQLEAHDLEPSAIILELTESAAMVDPERTYRLMGDLHEAGVGLAIDDFGTGYSSLSRLRDLPIDFLKIDRSFVGQTPEDTASSEMVAAIVQLANSLEIAPLAEGIETRRQLEFLVEYGCTLGQGFYLGRPVPAEEISARSGRWAKEPVPLRAV